MKSRLAVRNCIERLYRAATAVILFLGATVYAVDGIAVSCNFTGSDPGLHSNGLFGPIYAYIIKNSNVVQSKLLYSGKAKEAVINSQGTMVAFRKQISAGKGAICVAEISSGKVTELYVASDLMDEGRLAWPKGKWLYFQVGWPKYDSPELRGGNRIRRVDVTNGTSESWFDFSHAPWYYCFDSTSTRMVVRYMDDGSAPWGQNLKFELKSGKPPVSNLESLYSDSWAKFGSLGGYGCGAGLSPSGKLTSNFTSTSHNGWHIRNWQDGNVVATVGVNEFDKWGGTAFGGGNFGNKWSANSDEWICVRQAGRQVLIDWVKKERIVVTQKDKNETGDFWVGSPGVPSLTGLSIRPAIAPAHSRIAIDLCGRVMISEQPVFKTGSLGASGIRLRQWQVR